MLQTDDRVLLREAIRPPDGYEFDEGIITSYSLDLLTLLTVPLYFTLFEAESEDGATPPDPLALLQALRRHAARLTIFCQAGEIAVPARQQQLYGYLEPTVVEVQSPRPNGVFHPKVWALRYVRADAPVVYRLACFSRNLTADRSWDTAVILEGVLRDDRKVGFSQNRKLGEFIAALPSMAIRETPPAAATRAAQLAEELRKVAFEVPAGFEEYDFWPMGHDGRRTWPFKFSDRTSRMLVVSPFVSTSALGELAHVAEEVRLVSRPDELDRIDQPSLNAFTSVSVLADAVATEQAADAESMIDMTTSLTGLHAKLYVVDHGWRASLFTGSANATQAATECNVEFLVQLTGRKSVCGVDCVLTGGHGQNTLGALLQLYHRTEHATAKETIQQQLEDEVGRFARRLAALPLRLAAAVQPSGGYRLEVRGPGGMHSDGLVVRCWPITIAEEQGVAFDVDAEVPGIFPELSAEALTTFLAISVTATREGVTYTKRFVLNLPLEGGPADRRERILRTVLRDRQRVLRFLMLLLGDLDAIVGGDVLLPGEGANGANGRNGSGGVTLLEPLVRALHRDPTRLDQIARLIEELRSSGGEDLLPEDFGHIWTAIWAIRQGAVQ